MRCFQKNSVSLHSQSGCSAVGSALRSGRRGRQFESGHPDKKATGRTFSSCRFFCLILPNLIRWFVNPIIALPNGQKR